MNLDFFNSRRQDLDVPGRSRGSFVSSFMRELQEHLTRNRTTHFVLDRIEGDFAVLENQTNGRMVDVPINRIPTESIDGTVLKFENNTFSIDHEKGEKLSLEVRALREQIRSPFFTLDRFEGDFAVLENRDTGRMRNVSKHLIPEGAIDGDILRFENNVFSIDHEAAETARTEIRELLDRTRRN